MNEMKVINESLDHQFVINSFNLIDFIDESVRYISGFDFRYFGISFDCQCKVIGLAYFYCSFL
jgi:hypothetical protein